MSPRRIDLPQTLDACHQLILELYETIDELRARVAQLERELHGTKRERFVADENETREDEEAESVEDHGLEPAGPVLLEDTAVSPTVTGTLLPSDPAVENESPTPLPTVPGGPASGKPRRTSAGRRPRVYPPDTPRVQVFHPLDESKISPDLLHDPRARRFYRLVREEIEMPQRQIRILEHYQEVIAVDQVDELKTTMIAAPLPEPLIDRCSAGTSLLETHRSRMSATTSRITKHATTSSRCSPATKAFCSRMPTSATN